MIALNGRGIAGTGFRTLTYRRVAGRCATGATDMCLISSLWRATLPVEQF
jgi:hypothetical protein